jgi:hypothetical protein
MTNEQKGLSIVQTADDLYGKVESDTFYVYGSPSRPMNNSSSWGLIQGARFVNADYRSDRVHTFIVVPEQLDRATIQSYELTSEPMYAVEMKPQRVVYQAVYEDTVFDSASKQDLTLHDIVAYFCRPWVGTEYGAVIQHVEFDATLKLAILRFSAPRELTDPELQVMLEVRRYMPSVKID